MVTRAILSFYLCLYSFNLFAQDTLSTVIENHVISVKTQFIQIKDEFNYGLVFSGPNLVTGYSYTQTTSEDVLAYSPEIAFGGVFNKGAGFAWRFKPVDLYYGRNAGFFTIGLYLAADYQWQQYSELQGGRLYWFSAIEIGPRILLRVPYEKACFLISVSNSLTGLTSRPKPSTESYYYSFNLHEFISVAHQNLRHNSLGSFNRTKIGLELDYDTWSQFSLGYDFEYFFNDQLPSVSFLGHSINLNWKI